ncbi:OLC1v1019117C1 [Oldenlandia corymbosa var. corymbosa]|uniref:OLC1v1019117C1 n=1 Tax=Oldenlandia corymbosa var. corymbosa TaxID=529605 RepID=A0AAV1EDC4_OLDCO|nr:OLC1v1019117C1 [Oldenlandia corymbosa var. corymbosa]
MNQRLKELVQRKKMEKKEYSSSIYSGSFFGTSERLIVSQGVVQKRDCYSVRPGSLLRRIRQSRAEKDDGKVEDLDVHDKVECIKYSRDYSFLFSDDDAPAAAAPKVVSPSHVRIDSPEKKAVTTRVPVVVSQKKVSALPVLPMSSKQSSSTRKDDVNRPIRENKPKVAAAVVHKEVSRRPPTEVRRPMKRPRRHDDEDEDEKALRMLREMTGYDPRKYTDRGDDRNMEASFHDIEKEERKSSKLGRKEDEEELRKIAEEERMERLRKEAKERRKLR